MTTRTRMTAAEYYVLPETNRFEELINGELTVSPPPVPEHQRMVGRVFSLLEDIIPNGEVCISPIGVYLDDENSPEPDVVWVAENSRCKVAETRLEGPPDLVVEIFSPGTAKRDVGDKFELCERFGVGEYWMGSPQEAYLAVYRLENGRFARQGVYGPGDTFESAVLGKTVNLDKIFKPV